MANDAAKGRQLARFLANMRAEQHGCSLKAASLGVPCTDCLKAGRALSAHVESMLRLSYMRGHDDARASRMQDPERGVQAALNAFTRYY